MTPRAKPSALASASLIVAAIAALAWKYQDFLAVYSDGSVRAFGYGFAATVVSAFLWFTGIAFVEVFARIAENQRFLGRLVAEAAVTFVALLHLAATPRGAPIGLEVMQLAAVGMPIGLIALPAFRALSSRAVDAGWQRTYDEFGPTQPGDLLWPATKLIGAFCVVVLLVFATPIK